MRRSPHSLIGRRLGLLAVVCLAGWGAYVLVREEPHDAGPEPAPAATSPPPAVTVIKPLAPLAGAASCTECHADIAKQHAASGHSRTFSPTTGAACVRQLCGGKFAGDSRYGGYSYHCDERGLVAVSEHLQDRELRLEFAVGSGDRAATFLTLTTMPDGELAGLEHRATWIASRHALQVTPGQRSETPHTNIEFFGRIFNAARTTECIGCHTTSFSLAGDRVVDLTSGVQCEECHGPARSHVEAMRRADGEGASPELTPQSSFAEIAMCGRCHRMPEDIAPERLQKYPRALQRFQPVGLLRSRCYLESEGRLRCTTCHDPHAPASARTADQYESDCRACHTAPTGHECSAGQSSQCIVCHLQRSELIPGIFYHDHWIQKRPAEGAVDDESGEVGVSSN